MPLLFSSESAAANTGMAKSVSAAISVSTQVALAAGVISISGAVPRVVRPASPPLQFISAVVVPTAPIEIAPSPTPTPAPKEVVTAPETPSAENPALIPMLEPEKAKVPAYTAEVRPIENLVTPATSAPRPPEPIVGAFANSAGAAKVPTPARQIESAGFNLPAAVSRQTAPGTAAIGAFDTPTAGARQRETASPSQSVVADTGFNQPVAAMPAAPTATIREGGFGSAGNAERAKTHHTAELKTAVFDDARMTETTRKPEATPAQPAVIPVEVLSKPTPAYTDEARRLKIEGDVVLEVEFLAAGAVRVVKIVRGLGHGLDESAAVAAQKIQFKPATSQGRPIDVRTTVHIVFRLA
jgi:TonB family protein